MTYRDTAYLKPIQFARFMSHDPADSGLITETMFRQVIDHFVGFDLSEHEIITISKLHFN